MRRSGGSVLQKMISAHSEVASVDFEPQEIFMICERIDIPRYKNHPYFNEVLNRYKNHYEKWKGIHGCMNPGIEGMAWQNFPIKYPDAHYIFLERNPQSTYNSWVKNERSQRGICSWEMYLPWWEHLYSSFKKYHEKHPETTCWLKFEELVKNPNTELEKVWECLNLEKPNINFLEYIKQPEN